MHPPRTDLQGIEATLPPFVEGRDRPIRFALDGTITYDKERAYGSRPATLKATSATPRTHGDFNHSGRSVACGFALASAWRPVAASASLCDATTPDRPHSGSRCPTRCVPNARCRIHEQHSEGGWCKDCPGPEAAQQPGGIPGNQSSTKADRRIGHYLAMQQAIPPRNPNIITKYAWPSIREEDGRIVYATATRRPRRKVSRRLRRASFVRVAALPVSNRRRQTPGHGGTGRAGPLRQPLVHKVRAKETDPGGMPKLSHTPHRTHYK